jgi:hypothetical protein
MMLAVVPPVSLGAVGALTLSIAAHQIDTNIARCGMADI